MGVKRFFSLASQEFALSSVAHWIRYRADKCAWHSAAEFGWAATNQAIYLSRRFVRLNQTDRVLP